MFRATAVACFITAALGAASAEARQADVILVGARVLTADPARPTAEAVAVVGSTSRGSAARRKSSDFAARRRVLSIFVDEP
jgi:hypothetical protein